MSEADSARTLDRYEQLVRQQQQEPPLYILRLFVAGATRRSNLAVTCIKQLCEQHLAGRYRLEVIDIYQQPDRAKQEQILAAPTLVKELPPPLRKLIGDMTNTDRVLVGLGLRADDGGAYAARP
jgi:circadian clock protein KaiB